MLVNITLVLIVLILLLPRRWAALAVISGVIYVTETLFLSISGVDFTPIRFIILAGFIRVIVRKEFSFSELNHIDKSLLIFSSVYLLVFTFQLQFNPSPSSSLMYRLGLFCDGIMSYFIFRGLLKDPGMLRQFLRDMVFLMLPFTLLIIMESITGKNFFSIMGGVPETPILREGYYRSQASFRHAITAGTFGATLVPLFIGLAFSATDRFRAVIGIILGLSITIASHSSGPLMALNSGIAAWMCWSFRENMQMVRWAIVGAFISLALVMKAPVWFILARISDVIGGDGWHRANLIDKFVNHFSDWWLMGMPMENTHDWAATFMPWGGVDVTNMYVSVGIGGGLISLVLFFWLFKNCFQSIGRVREEIGGNHPYDRQSEALLWGLGSALFSHAMNFIGVIYWDQSYVLWYMSVAVISGVTGHYYNQENRSLAVKPVSPKQNISIMPKDHQGLS